VGQDQLAEKAGVRLVHENEHRIYGDEPERVKDLMGTVLEQADIRHFGAVYDPANYVHGGFDPWKGWELTRQWTVHFHIKDWVHGRSTAAWPATPGPHRRSNGGSGRHEVRRFRDP